MAHTPVHDKMNLAETEQAIRENSAALHQAEIEETAVRSEIQIQEGRQKDNAGKADNVNAAPSEDSGQSQGNAKSTEGGLYTDIALEASGVGGVAKLAKDGLDIISDMDPGKYAGLNTMENFAGIKGGANFKNSIQTPYVADLFARSKWVADSVNGEDKIKGAQADETSISSMQTTQKLKSVMSLEAQKHLGQAHARKAEIGHENQQERLNGPAMGLGGNTANINRAPNLALNEMKPKGPSQDMLEETGQA